MTWPLGRNLCCASADAEDPYINTWILDWDWWATLHQPLSLFQANTFYPAKDSLAFSEHLYGIAVLLFPLRAAGLAPLAAHNVAIIAGFAFCGFAAYLLGLQLTGSAAAGIAAGAFYAFVPFRFTHLTHVQHVWGGWLPMMAAALLHYARRPSWARAALFGAAFLMNGLTNVHWFLFGSIVVVLSVPIVVAGRRDWVRLAAAVAVAMLLLAPFLIPYATVSRLYGMRRSAAEAMESSALLTDWLNPGARSRVYRSLFDPSRNPETFLFPGLLGIACSVMGVVAVRRDRRGLSLALLWIALGFAGSLGLHTFFYRFLYAYVPGFQAVRVPARWANVAYVGMAMLIAFGAAWLGRRQQWTAMVLAAAFVIELRAAPIRWYLSADAAPAAHRWLATQDVRMAELPMTASSIEYWYTRWAAAHHRPMVNGASGFAPPEYVKLVNMWTNLGDDFVTELRSIGVDTLLVHGDEFQERERAWLRRELASHRLFFVRRFTHGLRGDWVFSLRRGAATSPQLETFLAGGYTYNDATFGILDYPLPNERLKNVYMSGFALSPYGLREVNFLFDNGAHRFKAELLPDPGVSRLFPWYDATPRPRFVRAFDKRPPGVRRLTDVQVEIIDGRGERTLLDNRWVEWP